MREVGKCCIPLLSLKWELNYNYFRWIKDNVQASVLCFDCIKTCFIASALIVCLGWKWFLFWMFFKKWLMVLIRASNLYWLLNLQEPFQCPLLQLWPVMWNFMDHLLWWVNSFELWHCNLLQHGQLSLCVNNYNNLFFSFVHFSSNNLMIHQNVHLIQQ